MNYASAIVKATKAFYNAINPATLSAIDVIVVEQPDGEYKSTPFHIRFGKYGVWSHSEKYVDIEINGEDVDLKMKLGDSGVAYFVEAADHSENVADYLITSPILDGTQSPQNPVNAPRTDMVLAESARKLEELPRRSEHRTTPENPPERGKSPGEQSLHAIHQVNWPFTSSVFSSRKYRSLPELNNISEDTESDIPTTTKDDNYHCSPHARRKKTRLLKSSKSDGGSLKARCNPEESTKSKRRKNGGSKSNRFYVEDSDSEPEILKQFQNEHRSIPEMREICLADGALSDSELDRHKKNEENLQNERMTDWKWGQLPETKENKEEVPKKNQKGRWSWYFWRSSSSVPTKPCDEGITLDELQADPSKAEKYLGKLTHIDEKLADGSCSVDCQLIDELPKEKTLLQSKSRLEEQEIKTQEATIKVEEEESTLGRSRIVSTSSTETVGDDVESIEGIDGIYYYRSLRLSSNRLKSLGLRYGANEARFSITTMYQGTSWCACNIYLYKWYEQIVISDIDGTITKSDVLGHVIPAIGGQWAHSGVADLYTRIKNNGYKMVYLSSRAIGQSHTTKQYLRSVAQDSKQLPDGPVLLSPSSVLMAFRKEVIERRPEEFKIAALTDLKKLFPVPHPFFAGFGNRETDTKSYRAVDIPSSRILIVDPSGRVRRSDSVGYVTSYNSMASETVDYLFPPLSKNVKYTNGAYPSNVDTLQRSSWHQPLECSAFTHWKIDTDEVEAELLAYEAKRKAKK